jgi:hypothetical protein
VQARIRFVEDEAQSQPRAISGGILVAAAWMRKWPRLVQGQSNRPKRIQCTPHCLSPRSMKRPCKYDNVVRLSSSSSSVPLRAKFLETRAQTDRCEACVARLFATREVLVKSTRNPWGIVCASHP